MTHNTTVTQCDRYSLLTTVSKSGLHSSFNISIML